jgi:pimeloyl-ACP methyl ester carboxylesterase
MTWKEIIMADIVLVHGAWHGGWCWSRVTPLLVKAGHRVHGPTLTGLGDRRHLLSRRVDLKTHIEDVVGVIDNEELKDVLLVGHSYAGIVVTGVADLVAGRIKRLVYLDAILPLPGESWSSPQSPETVANRIKAADASGGLTLPAPDPEVFGLKGADREWVARRQAPHPFATYQEPLDFDFERWKALPRTYVDCFKPALPSIDSSKARMKSQGDWDVRRLESGHDPMVQCPQELADLLKELL